MTAYRSDPVTAQDAPALAPLVQSHEADQLESELKALFVSLFEDYLRNGERTLNTVGTPHLGPFDQVERAVKNEGLALFRRPDEDAMRYLFRAWRARNPKRGLHMLRCYLQLLWPNGWTTDQLWQWKGHDYPTKLDAFPDPSTKYLTSRVRVGITSPDTTGDDVLAAVPALRSVVPARILLEFALLTRTQTDLGMAAGFYRGFNVQRFEGSFV